MTHRTAETETTLAQKIGRLLRVERQKIDLTQEQLAQRLGVSRQFVSRFELGRQGMTCAVIEAMFRGLGLQLRPDLEMLDRELDDEIARSATDGRIDRDSMIGSLHAMRRYIPGAPEMVIDGAVAAHLLGVPVNPQRLDLAIAEADLEQLAKWMYWLPGIRRYDERRRDYDSMVIDPREPGVMRWRYGDSEIGITVVSGRPDAVVVRHETGELKVRPLSQVTLDHPEVARFLDRTGKRSPPINNH